MAQGATQAACEIKNVADGTHANSVVTKQQLEANISASKSVDSTARSNLSTTLTANYTAHISTQAALTFAARTVLQSNIDTEENARIAAINAEQSTRASAILTEQNARAAAITTEQQSRAADISTEVSERNAAISTAVSAHDLEFIGKNRVVF